MGRKPRIQFDGGVYHIVRRGNNMVYISKRTIKKTAFKYHN